jgi:hypothetical protein
MEIADKAILVTRANRGLGRALVEEALSESMAESWRSGAAKAHERLRAALVAQNATS